MIYGGHEKPAMRVSESDGGIREEVWDFGRWIDA